MSADDLLTMLDALDVDYGLHDDGGFWCHGHKDQLTRPVFAVIEKHLPQLIDALKGHEHATASA